MAKRIPRCNFQGVVKKCNNPVHLCGLCVSHYGERFGEALPTYEAVHYLLRKQRGSARQYVCVICGLTAADWSYDHEDPDELTGIIGSSRRLCAYSLNFERYQPRCRQCHVSMDQKLAFHGRRLMQASDLEPEIRAAIASREKASSLEEAFFWDGELDRLSAQLLRLSTAG